MSRSFDIVIPPIEGMTITFAGPAELRLSGVIAMKDPREALGGFFRKVHELTVARGEKEFVVDVVDLKFVNSSAIRLFVDWAMWLKSEKAAYRLRFKSNRSVAWQRTAFSALKSLAQDALTVEVVVG
jgi:hypothetical protein